MVLEPGVLPPWFSACLAVGLIWWVPPSQGRLARTQSEQRRQAGRGAPRGWFRPPYMRRFLLQVPGALGAAGGPAPRIQRSASPGSPTPRWQVFVTSDLLAPASAAPCAVEVLGSMGTGRPVSSAWFDGQQQGGHATTCRPGELEAQCIAYSSERHSDVSLLQISVSSSPAPSSWAEPSCGHSPAPQFGPPWARCSPAGPTRSVRDVSSGAASLLGSDRVLDLARRWQAEVMVPSREPNHTARPGRARSGRGPSLVRWAHAYCIPQHTRRLLIIPHLGRAPVYRYT